MRIAADSHVHTLFSADADDDMAAMCKAAIEKGLQYICFTEHVDFNQFDPGCRYFNYDKYIAAIERTRDEFGDKIQILSGIEFGEPHVFPKEFESIAAHEFDVVMAGIHYIGENKVGLHWLNGTNAYYQGLLQDYTQERILQEYYRELLQVVTLGGFDVLAHLDNPKRYLPQAGQAADLAAGIAHELVKAGIALEINTSPLRRGGRECSPDAAILAQYLACGGKQITVGSDAHRCSEVAANFDYAAELAEAHQATVGVFIKRSFVPV